MTVQPTTPLDPGPVVDGRRLRSEASRLRIVEAMIALARSGRRVVRVVVLAPPAQVLQPLAAAGVAVEVLASAS